jgi:DNA-binding MarR family transcriptional regulator
VSPSHANRLKRPVEHDDLLNFRLKRLLTLGAAPAIRLCEGRYGVARAQWRMVAALVEDGPGTPGELVVRTGLDPARASRLVAEVVAKGLARRGARAPGARVARVEPTEAGRALYAALMPELAAINARLAAVLDDDEAAVLDRCLDKLTVHARAILDAGGGVDAKADRRAGGSRRVLRPGAPPPRASTLD